QFVDTVMSVQEGFVVFDSERRLVLCNDTYRQFYVDAVGQEIADLIVPGAYQLDFLAAAFEAGMFPDVQGTTEEYVEQRRQRQKELRRAVEIRFSSGTWAQVNERPTHDGGYVAVYTDITELKRREAELAEKTNVLERLSNQLAKYLSPQIYQSIFSGRQEVKVASSRKKLTVFFSDIADFTETADKLESEELTQLLNHYLTEMSRIALEYGATIDKFIGDAIMIFFGDPETKGVKADAQACVRMAIAMRDRMDELQRIWSASGIEKPLRCRMGIHTDYCTVGNFGSDDRMDYTIIGGGVNLASRLEAASSPGEILISYETHAHIKSDILCEERGEVDVKGMAYPVATYRVIDLHEKMNIGDRPVHAELPHFQLDMDVASMSADDQRKATAELSRALERLSSGTPKPK
ncbi:MAG: guanylyl cyclase, partial [Rhodospirillaceae bacterium]|nr:guanylyl cyclase [Rhodospirillaceae bacterium]